MLGRHVAYEAILTSVLLFATTTAVRWVVGPSAVSRSLGSTHAQLGLVGAIIGLFLALLIVSPLGRESGGHMNPAITVAMWRYRAFPGIGVPAYVAGQLAGSTVGVLAGRLAWGAVVTKPPVTFAVLQPAQGWSYWALFGVETLTMTAILLVAGILLASRHRPVTPFAIGALVGGTIAGLGTLSGGSANPARQFGPALLSGQTHFLTAYLLAPIAGALIAPTLRGFFQRGPVSTHSLCGSHITAPSPGHRDAR